MEGFLFDALACKTRKAILRDPKMTGKKIIYAIFLMSMLLLLGCVSDENANGEKTNSKNQIKENSGQEIARLSIIPSHAVKITPATDIYPPQMHSDDWKAPIPLDAAINTAGAEDSPFITPDGNELYFFFTPDPGIPAEKQLLDGVTGIYVSKKQENGSWTEAKRVVLQDAGKLALDGCEFVLEDMMWFCSAREGHTGINWFTAKYVNGKWQDWNYAGNAFKEGYEVGELHISANGNKLYYHSSRPGGRGGLDIWMTNKSNGEWQEPTNINAVNSANNEGWPFISQDGKELWFLRTYLGSPALFRSKNINGEWQAPELIISQFAGEPSLDSQGNLYFVHHFYKDGKMLEADIYVAYRKKTD